MQARLYLSADAVLGMGSIASLPDTSMVSHDFCALGEPENRELPLPLPLPLHVCSFGLAATHRY